MTLQKIGIFEPPVCGVYSENGVIERTSAATALYRAAPIIESFNFCPINMGRNMRTRGAVDAICDGLAVANEDGIEDNNLARHLVLARIEFRKIRHHENLKT